VPIVCDALPSPPHSIVIPSSAVMAGEEVTIYCLEGYEEYYGGTSLSSLEAQNLAVEPRNLKDSDPWTDYDDWLHPIPSPLNPTPLIPNIKIRTLNPGNF